MGLRRGSKYYVRGNYTVKGSSFTEKDYQDHLSYIESVARERYLIGGGFSNIDGGMILFAADNFDKAQRVAWNDPLMERDIYRFDLLNGLW